MSRYVSRRDFLRTTIFGAAAFPLIGSSACAQLATPMTSIETPDPPGDEDLRRLLAWTAVLRAENLAGASVPIGRSASRTGELAIGSPYEAFTLEGYIRAGGDPTLREPLFLSLTRYDCVSLVESCIALSRSAGANGEPRWEKFAREVERMRYRDGVRLAYSSRLHYFSEWMSDGAKRGLVEELGAKLGGVNDGRPLRFMTEHRRSYPALANDEVFTEISRMERSLDDRPRLLIPTDRIPGVADRIATGDVLGFATSIPGLDVSHSAFAYRDANGALRVLHAPLSGGAVEVSRLPLQGYVAAIRRSTGILIARPLRD